MALDGNLRDEEGHVLAPGTRAANILIIDTHGALGNVNGGVSAQALIDNISGKTKTLIGDDANKSVRTIANEELVARLIPGNAKEALDTLQEIAAWIQAHPDDAAAMSTAITDLQNTRIPYKTGGGLGSCSGGGSYTYCKIATFKIASSYVNRPITMEISGRGRHTSTIQIVFQNSNSTDPGLSTFDTDYDTCFWMKKTATSTWELYFQYSESWGNCVLHRITGAGAEDVATITINMTNVSSLPSGSTQVARPFKTQADIDAAVTAAKVGNAAMADVLAGKTFTNSFTSGLTGTMPNRGAVSVSLNTSTTSYTVPAGYHNGSGKVSITLEEKSSTPNVSANKVITPSSNKVLSKVTIQPLIHSNTFVPSENKANVNMGEYHTYRYVDTRTVYNRGYNSGYSEGYSDGQAASSGSISSITFVKSGSGIDGIPNPLYTGRTVIDGLDTNKTYLVLARANPMGSSTGESYDTHLSVRYATTLIKLSTTLLGSLRVNDTDPGRNFALIIKPNNALIEILDNDGSSKYIYWSLYRFN